MSLFSTDYIESEPLINVENIDRCIHSQRGRKVVTIHLENTSKHRLERQKIRSRHRLVLKSTL